MNKDISEQYDQIGNEYISSQSKFFSGTKDEAFQYLTENLSSIKGKVLLDLGCGHGNDILKYQKMGFKEIYGIDSSELMAQKAKLSVTHPENISVQNIEKTKFKNNSFDIVVARYSLHYLKSFNKAYTEIHRILKHDGTFSFVVPHPFRDLTMQQNKTYGTKEEIAAKLYDGKVIVRYPSHTFQDYLSDAFCTRFELINFTEVSQSDEYEKDEFSLPGFVGITAIKK